MSTLNIFQISFEIWGCIISIIVCILMNTLSFKEDALGKKLWKMILINNFILVSDALAYIYRGDTTLLGVAMTHASNFALYALELMLLVIFVRYVKCLTYEPGDCRPRIWEYAALIIPAVAFAGLIVTQFTGLYYFFDDTNHYRRGYGAWINFAACIAVILICTIKLWLSRKKLIKKFKTILSVCLIIFCVCIALQFMFYGLSLINIGITISLLLMYLSHYKTQYDLYVNNSIEEAVGDAQAILTYKSANDIIEGKIQEADNETHEE